MPRSRAAGRHLLQVVAAVGGGGVAVHEAAHVGELHQLGKPAARLPVGGGVRLAQLGRDLGQAQAGVDLRLALRVQTVQRPARARRPGAPARPRCAREPVWRTRAQAPGAWRDHLHLGASAAAASGSGPARARARSPRRRGRRAGRLDGGARAPRRRPTRRTVVTTSFQRRIDPATVAVGDAGAGLQVEQQRVGGPLRVAQDQLRRRPGAAGGRWPPAAGSPSAARSPAPSAAGPSRAACSRAATLSTPQLVVQQAHAGQRQPGQLRHRQQPRRGLGPEGLERGGGAGLVQPGDGGGELVADARHLGQPPLLPPAPRTAPPAPRPRRPRSRKPAPGSCSRPAAAGAPASSRSRAATAEGPYPPCSVLARAGRGAPPPPRHRQMRKCSRKLSERKSVRVAPAG